MPPPNSPSWSLSRAISSEELSEGRIDWLSISLLKVSAEESSGGGTLVMIASSSPLRINGVFPLENRLLARCLEQSSEELKSGEIS